VFGQRNRCVKTSTNRKYSEIAHRLSNGSFISKSVRNSVVRKLSWNTINTPWQNLPSLQWTIRFRCPIWNFSGKGLTVTFAIKFMWMLITNTSKFLHKMQQNVEISTRRGRRLSLNNGKLRVHGFLCFSFHWEGRVTVKLNLTLQQATKAQRGSRGIAIFFL
jgi:hypothetical protein